MELGWIKLHRKLLEWEWYDDANTFRLFIHCLLECNYTDKKWRGIIIEKGSFITSHETIAKKLKLSRQQIRTSINKLILSKNITIKTTNKYTVVTVVKYSDYQFLENENNQQNNKQITNKQPTNNQQITTTKNIKNINKEKKENKVFIPPTIFELKQYFKENGYNEQSAEKMFNYYDVANWHDAKGNKIKNWKQKAQSVWFKDENKATTVTQNGIPIPTAKMVY
jgi:biotin operon repressor